MQSNIIGAITLIGFCDGLENLIKLCGDKEIVVLDDLDSWIHPSIQNFSGSSPTVISSFRTKQRPSQVKGMASDFLKECLQLLTEEGNRKIVVWSDFEEWESVGLRFNAQSDYIEVAPFSKLNFIAKGECDGNAS